MTDLWTEASYDHEGMARQAALDLADAELREVFPFLAAARSGAEFGHRMALAQERLTAIALRHGLEPGELTAMAQRRWELLVEALNEGMDPLTEVVNDSHASGGPEKPDEHDTGPDFSHGYSEVPQGPPGGPNPAVTRPVQPGPAPVQEATGAVHTACSACGCGTGKKGKCKGCGKKGGCSCGPSSPCGGMQAHASRRTADASTAGGSVETGVGSNMPVAGAPEADLPIAPPSIGQVTSSTDPVRRQVLAVTASVKASNPSIADEEAARIARQVVGRYLTADLASSVTNDDPAGGGGSGGGNGGGNLAAHMLEGQGLRSMIPGGGGGAAEGAGAGLAETALEALA